MAVTKLYPFAKFVPTSEYRGNPHISPELCIGCAACVRACPPDALLSLDDLTKGVRKIVFDSGRCIRCARCEEVCPTGAIKLTDEFELASPDRKDHVEIVELKLVKCESCGGYADFTERQIKKALQILPKAVIDAEGLAEILRLCRKCRMQNAVEKVAEFKGEVEG